METHWPIQILLVEDDAATASRVEDALCLDNAPTRYCLVKTDRLAKALQHLQDHAFDVVLLDLGLPDGTGLETLERIRAANDQIPVVVLAGREDEDRASAAVQQGAQDYLRKEDDLGSLPFVVRYATDRRRFDDELARSNAELAQFIYIASHDLQEPLRGIEGTIQLLAERYRGKLGERADEYIRHAVDGVNRMQAMIEDLLAYSRVTTKGGPLRATDMEAVFREVAGRFAPIVQQSRGQLTHDPLPQGIQADASQMRQLLHRLIDNGLKFRSPDRAPHVHVSARRDRDAWVFEVRDNGIGIEPQYFAQIFRVFQRLHTRREYPGTGIGLALCKKIIERHEGRIWLESEVGRGTSVFFSLPVAPGLDVTRTECPET